jgi:hypothetical protein
VSFEEKIVLTAGAAPTHAIVTAIDPVELGA